MKKILIESGPVLASDVDLVSKAMANVDIAPDCIKKLTQVRQKLLSELTDGKPRYGINTGFGALGKVSIDEDSLEQLQANLIRSHATGVGDYLPERIVRAMMFLLCASLARGHSGVRPDVVNMLTTLLNSGLTPAVPETGSVGASGDLAPLAHVALAMMGEGKMFENGQLKDASDCLKAASLKPIRLQAKEGLALINGTHLMAARGALILEDFKRFFKAALLAAAMSVDACRATAKSLEPRIHEIRKQPGQKLIAGWMMKLLKGSQILASHLENDPRVQDPYSFRCCAAVLGSAWDAFKYFEQSISNELGAVTDNPLLFETENGLDILSGGNFHGMPIALPLDVISIAITHIAGVSERRVYHMLSGIDAEAKLPTFMTPQAGLQSGLMIAQYSAAACCNEMIGLSNPASVANLSTSAGMEDYNSFGPRAAAKARRCLDLACSVVAIELHCASNGIEHHRPLKTGEPVEQAIEIVRKSVPPLKQDRPPHPDILAIEQLIEDDQFSFVDIE